MIVASVLRGLDAECVQESRVAVGVQQPFDDSDVGIGGEPTIADEVPHFVSLDVMNRDLIEIPVTQYTLWFILCICVLRRRFG